MTEFRKALKKRLDSSCLRPLEHPCDLLWRCLARGRQRFSDGRNLVWQGLGPRYLLSRLSDAHFERVQYYRWWATLDRHPNR